MTSSAAVTTTSSAEDHTRLLHAHFGYMSEKRMIILSKRGLLRSESMSKLDFYDHCVFRKQEKFTLSTAIHRTQGTLDYIHSDLGSF